MRSGGLHRLLLASVVLLPAVSATPAHAATAADVRAAVIALSHEAQDLLTLNAFPASDPLNALEAALSNLPLAPRGARSKQVAQLKTDDAAGARARAKLQQGSNPSVEVLKVLQPLSSAQLAAVTSGKKVTEPQAGEYLKALEDLVVRNGATTDTQGARPDPPTVNQGIAQALGIQVAQPSGPPGQQPGGLQPGGQQPGGQTTPSSSDRPVWPWFLVGAAVLGGAAYLLTRRRPPSAPPLPMTRPAAAAPPVASILDASRRLTTLTGEEVPRAIVREALALVPGMAAAVVERQQGDLVVTHESQPGVLRPEGFHHGVIETAANTGQMLVQVISNDPSFSRQPAQVVLLPLVSAGRVEAVVVVTRDATQTFTPAERDALAAFAPVAAAARESAARTQAAVDASQIDPLTGAGNRRQLDTHLPIVLREAGGGSTGFCMIDLDHFKTVNDTFGHPAGDALLRGVCDTIRSAVRPTDGVYRYGGEEFCVLLPATDLEEAADIAERVRAAIATNRYDVGSARPLTVTASLGVAVTESTELDDIVNRADRALYQAKQSGRNQVRRG
jgi:diguanylate cyclase (GGDEF)-like protein